MNTKRWIALGVAVALFVVSIGFQFVSSLATADFESMFKMPTNQEYGEKVIEEGSGNKIAVLELQGVIQDSAGGSLLNSSAYNHDQFMKKLENAGEDSSVSGIILRINTPGGGVVESDEIHDLVVEIKKEQKKPIYVSMGNTAASGGYYVSAAADKIIAHPATLTGSIGVIMQSINYAEFANNHGIKFNTIKSGEFKDIMSPSRKMTKEERKILQTMIDGLYANFVEVIVKGRDMSESKVRELGDGRVYTGQQAKNNGLVDALGSLDDTIAIMEKDNDWSDAKVVKYTSGFQFNEFLGGTMQSMFGAKTDLFGLTEILRESDGPRAMYLYSK